MRRQTVRRWVARAAALVAVVTASTSGAAQGCAMCYNTAAAAKAGAIHALRSGILILLIPPVVIFGAVCTFALRNQDRFGDDNATIGDDLRFPGRQIPALTTAVDVTSPDGSEPGMGTRNGNQEKDCFLC